MTSRQSMNKTNTAPVRGNKSPSKEVKEVPAKEQDVTEYVVIQQLIWNGKDAGWRVWGTTTPTTMHQVWNDPSFAPGMTAVERIDALRNFMQK